ncbi:MAG: hypothetical protein ABSB83_03295 [Methanomassiliicoccales archaeon]
MRDEIEILDGYSLKELPRHPPRLIKTEGFHFDEVLMAKGKFLVYRAEANGSLVILELADLPSRFVGDFRESDKT